MCHGTTGDEKCICFSLKLIMARARTVLLNPKEHLRCLWEVGKGGSRRAVLKALCPCDEALGSHSKAGILLSGNSRRAVCVSLVVAGGCGVTLWQQAEPWPCLQTALLPPRLLLLSLSRIPLAAHRLPTGRIDPKSQSKN